MNCRVYSCICQINYNIYSVPELKNGAVCAPEDEEEVNDEDDEGNDVAEAER